MKNVVPILAIALTAAFTAHAGVITITLDSSTLSGASGSVLHFSGTLTNTTGALVYLNADNINSSLPDPTAIDDSPFWNNAPVSLGANGTSGDIGLFDVTILASFGVGSYLGTFMLLGGAGVDSQDILGAADFTVNVTAPTPGGAAPEPETLPLLGAATGALLAWKRFRPAVR
jgi:hypothetical protein